MSPGINDYFDGLMSDLRLNDRPLGAEIAACRCD
jgi:hypothetical protein